MTDREVANAAVARTHYELAVATNLAGTLTPELCRMIALKAIAFIAAEHERNRMNCLAEGGTAGDLANRPTDAPAKGKRGNGAAP